MNLVAARDQASSTPTATPLQYVVLAGGDDVIPFFRYPDTAGLGHEADFVPPVLDGAPRRPACTDQVLSQDAYGARTEMTISGATLPVPDLAVGRLVETPAEIDGVRSPTTSGIGQRHAAAPDLSLVTGYDFLADAAHRGARRVRRGPARCATTR